MNSDISNNIVDDKIIDNINYKRGRIVCIVLICCVASICIGVLLYTFIISHIYP